MRLSAVPQVHDETARPALTSSQHELCVSPTANRRGEEHDRDDAGHTTLAECGRSRRESMIAMQRAVSEELTARR
jgi:hypothetical protein